MAMSDTVSWVRPMGCNLADRRADGHGGDPAVGAGQLQLGAVLRYRVGTLVAESPGCDLFAIPARPDDANLRPDTSPANGGSVRVLVSMCVDGSGPFPFVMDTGAPSTLFDTHFLDHVRLSANGPVGLLRQPRCTVVVIHDSVQRWSIGPIGLTAQPVSVIRMPGFGLAGQPMGVLGSDVLSRFGAVRVDYDAQRLTVAGLEGQSSVPGTSVNGPTSAPVPQGLLGPGMPTVLPLDVSTSTTGTSVMTAVTFDGRGPFPFDVATGAANSAVAAGLVAQQGLVETGQTEPVRSFGCFRSAPVVKSGPWAIGAVALLPRLLTAAVSVTSPAQAEGLLGSDVLGDYGWVVLDYRSGSLLLGAQSSSTPAN